MLYMSPVFPSLLGISRKIMNKNTGCTKYPCAFLYNKSILPFIANDSVKTPKLAKQCTLLKSNTMFPF